MPNGPGHPPRHQLIAGPALRAVRLELSAHEAAPDGPVGWEAMVMASGWYLAIEGATGAGKTTLAKRLAPALTAVLFLDPFGRNPFLTQLAADTPAIGWRLGWPSSACASRNCARSKLSCGPALSWQPPCASRI